MVSNKVKLGQEKLQRKQHRPILPLSLRNKPRQLPGITFRRKELMFRFFWCDKLCQMDCFSRTVNYPNFATTQGALEFLEPGTVGGSKLTKISVKQTKLEHLQDQLK
jgi:hypothetical protein